MDFGIDLEQVFKWIGIVSSLSFVGIAFGDFVVASLNILVKRTATTRDDLWANKVEFWWEAVKEIYEEMRKFFDKFSTFSRPRKGK